MQKEARKIIPLTSLALVLLMVAPLASASTLTVNLNPKTGLAEVHSVSTTTIVFTYPAGTAISNYLKNVSSSVKLNSSFVGGTSSTQQLQGSFDDEDSHIQVQNMSVALDYTVQGSSTQLTINKVTNVTTWVTGAFRVVNGTVHADLGWKAFVVRGAWDLNLEDHTVDVNLVGSTMQESLAAHALAAGFLLNTFGGGSIWDRPTLNFSALNTPLSTWTKNFDAGTNTTTFSKTVTGSETFKASLDINNQNYTLSSVSDPSGTVSVAGYANASGDSLEIVPAPPLAMYSGLLTAAVVVVVALGAGGYLYLRSRPKAAKTTP